jgi:hypothetical protein
VTADCGRVICLSVTPPRGDGQVWTASLITMTPSRSMRRCFFPAANTASWTPPRPAARNSIHRATWNRHLERRGGRRYVMYCMTASATTASLRPAHIHRIRAGERSRGVTTPDSLVYLPVSLTGPGPSGSTEPTRLCRGCSHLPGDPRNGCLQLHPTATTAGDGGLSPPSEPTAPRGAACCLSATGIRFLGILSSREFRPLHSRPTAADAHTRARASDP